MHVLGIDAGGTKTVCLLADADGRILSESRGDGANLKSVGELEVEKTLHRVMEAAIGERDVRLAAICLGIAGVDRPGDAEQVRGIMRRIGFKASTLVVNDGLIALVAGAGEGPGVVLVAGTGSIAYGRNEASRAARAGGWGHLIGDEGGAFWIGRSALSAVVRQFDGRGPATLLTEKVLKHLGLSSPTELIPEVYERDMYRPLIAGIAVLVQRAADGGDAVAADILHRAAGELVAAAASVIAQLGMRGDAFPILLSGGVFHGIPKLVSDVAARLSEVAPRGVVRLLDVEPALGAVRLALGAAKGRVTIPTYV
jgi:N-acetylglucosamine kinase-like BadF-type ATPase